MKLAITKLEMKNWMHWVTLRIKAKTTLTIILYWNELINFENVFMMFMLMMIIMMLWFVEKLKKKNEKMWETNRKASISFLNHQSSWPIIWRQFQIRLSKNHGSFFIRTTKLLWFTDSWISCLEYLELLHQRF